MNAVFYLHINQIYFYLRFQAAKNGKPILIPIALMNNHRMLVTADSVTTVQELCHQICDRIGITDDSGFSVYITLMQRVSVVDASSFCLTVFYYSF